jgi:hypothetical protein
MQAREARKRGEPRWVGRTKQRVRACEGGLDEGENASPTTGVDGNAKADRFRTVASLPACAE